MPAQLSELLADLHASAQTVPSEANERANSRISPGLAEKYSQLFFEFYYITDELIFFGHRCVEPAFAPLPHLSGGIINLLNC